MVRFAIVGVVNSVFGFGVFAGLQFAVGGRVHYLVLLLISHVASVLEAYALQRWLVFRVSGRWWRDLARFWSVYLVALTINLIALPLLVEVVHMSVLPAQAMIMVLMAIGTFVAHRTFTFRRLGDQSAAPLLLIRRQSDVEVTRVEIVPHEGKGMFPCQTKDVL